jgi:hypothetical protein
MGLKMLSLLTGRDSIALDGYKYGLETLHENYRMFDRFFREDPLFGARFAHLLDKSFQNFATRLQRYHKRSSPIRSARRQLEFLMEDELGKILSSSHLGISPRIVLPPELLISTDPVDETDGRDESPSSPKNPKKPKALVVDDAPSWHVTNEHPVSKWVLTDGKKFPAYFDSKDPKTKDNLLGWPKFPHHSQANVTRAMCVKYQTLGRCRKACNLTHVDPDKMTSEVRAKCDARFAKIYA